MLCRSYTQPGQMQPIIMGWIQIVFLLVNNAIELLNFFLFLFTHCLSYTFSFLPAEAFLGKGFFKKRISYHARGKHGIKERPECRLTVVLRELTPEEEAKIARLRVSNFRKLTKRERQLIPHKLIETTPIWGRKSKANSSATSGMTS